MDRCDPGDACRTCSLPASVLDAAGNSYCVDHAPKCKWAREVYDYMGPVEYAHWKSGCGKTFLHSDKHGFKFCPYCGARIRNAPSGEERQ